MVVEPKATPVTLNVPVVPPGGIETLVGLKLTCPVARGSAESITLTPLCGAGEESVIVPERVRVSPIAVALLFNATEMDAVETFTVSLSGGYPPALAII